MCPVLLVGKSLNFCTCCLFYLEYHSSPQPFVPSLHSSTISFAVLILICLQHRCDFISLGKLLPCTPLNKDLLVWKAEWQDRGEVSLPCGYWFTPQMAAIIGFRLGWSQEPRTLAEPLMWVVQALGLSTPVFPGTLAGNWIESGAAEVWTSGCSCLRWRIILLCHLAIPQSYVLL